jgi:hypothetical protein
MPCRGLVGHKTIGVLTYGSKNCIKDVGDLFSNAKS